MDNDTLNSFHYFDATREDLADFDKFNNSAFNNHLFSIFPLSSNSMKKMSLDMSDSEDHNFLCDKLNISEIKPIDNNCKYPIN